MSIDPTQIELTLEQKERLAVLAQQEGKNYTEVVDELLSSVSMPDKNGASGVPSSSLYEALDSLGAIGCFEGPGDLSTNPKHMEGFGINASRRRTDSD